MNKLQQKLIIIVGPTATGKSDLAVDLASDVSGEIVSADSMQVYRKMDIGTAKLALEERRGILHHLIDVVNPDEDFNASQFRSFADSAIKKMASNQTACFVVGGTGLYIKALLGGLLECPPVDSELREQLAREYDEQGSSHLYNQLKKIDPESASKIHPNDKTRVIRALEINVLTQKTASSLAEEHRFGENPFRTLKIFLHADREELYERINKRSRLMIDSGLIEEVEGLLNMGYSSHLKSMKSLGYRHVVQYLSGNWSKEKMISQLQADTRRYAKRQFTWFKADPEMVWIKPTKKNRILEMIKEFVG